MPDGKMGGGFGPIDSPKSTENKDGTYTAKPGGGKK